MGSDPAGDGRNPGGPAGFESQTEAALDGLDEDVRLMLAFREGDGAAFEDLFRRWAAPLLRYLERMLRDAATAEELVQEVFLRVHCARDRYQPEARFSTWLYRIATNLALNELRRPRRRDPHQGMGDEGAQSLAAKTPAADDVVHARRLGEAALRELEALPERQRAALWLSAVEGLAYSEVAVILDASEKAVKALVHRARSALVEKLQEGG